MHSGKKGISDFLGSIYGLECISIAHIAEGINDNFLIETAEGRYLFKVYIIHNEDRRVRKELNIVSKLESYKFPCPRIIETLHQEKLSFFNDKPCALFQYIEGEMVREVNTDLMKTVGELLGTFHTLLKEEVSPSQETWEPADIQSYMRKYHSKIVRRNMVGALEFMTFLEKEFSTLSLPKDLPVGLTHQDVKSENIIISPEGKIHFIDFNNMYRGVLLYDVATSIIWMGFDEKGRIRPDVVVAYLKGYESRRPLTSLEKEMLFEALRFRLLREAFVWPMRWFNPKRAPKLGKHFLKLYKNLPTREFFMGKVRNY